MKKKAYIFIFLFLFFLIVIAVAVFLIVAINKPTDDSTSTITSHTISSTDDNCWILDTGKVVCFVGSIEISESETIEESFDVSIDNHKN